MRVLQVNKAYHPHIGGIETIVRSLAEGMASKHGLDVEVLVCGGEHRTSVRQVNGIPVRYVAQWGSAFSLPISPSFPYWLGQYSGDVLQIHDPFPLAALSLLFLRNRISSLFHKTIVWWHSDIVRQAWSLPLYAPMLRRYLDVVDQIIVATPHHIQSSRFLPAFRDKCQVIPFGIPLERFQLTQDLEGIKSLRAQIGSPMLLFVGRLVYYKGVEYLIRAMCDLPGCRLVVVGSGPLEKELKSLATELGREGDVVFVPHVSEDELVKFYHACDVFVLPSIRPSEAFGIVQLEAMACGKPVVSTSLNTGVTFVNQHGKTGLTVPPEDAQSLAEAIQRLLQDRKLYDRLGQYAQLRVQKEFSQELMISKTLQLYRKLLSN